MISHKSMIKPLRDRKGKNLENSFSMYVGSVFIHNPGIE